MYSKTKRKLMAILGVMIFLLTLFALVSLTENRKAKAQIWVPPTVYLPSTYMTFYDNKDYTGTTVKYGVDLNSVFDIKAESFDITLFNGRYVSTGTNLKFNFKPTNYLIIEKDYISNDTSKTYYTPDGIKKTLNSEIGTGMLYIKYPSGYEEVYLNCIKENPSSFIKYFDAPGIYKISFYFESYYRNIFGIHTDILNHRMDYTFEIIPDNGSYTFKDDNKVDLPLDTLDTVYAKSSYLSSKNITGTQDLAVRYQHTNLQGITSSVATAYVNSTNFTAPGKYSVWAERGPWQFFEKTIIIDPTTPKDWECAFNSLAVVENGVNVFEGGLNFNWLTENQCQAPRTCKIYKDSGGGFKGSVVNSNYVNGSNFTQVGDYIFEIDNGLDKQSYRVMIKPVDYPENNYNTLSTDRFNNVHSVWYEYTNTSGKICAYPINAYQLVLQLVNNNPDKIRKVYFDPNDKTERTFYNSEAYPMFDNKPYLDDDFMFTSLGPTDSYTIEIYNKGNSSLLVTLTYGEYGYNTNIKNIPVLANFSGELKIVERDLFGNAKTYEVMRDKTMPIVKFFDGINTVTAVDKSYYKVDYFGITEFFDSYDDWAVLKMNDKYYTKGDDFSEIFGASGIYEIKTYDRNLNKIEFVIEVNKRSLNRSIEFINSGIIAELEDGATYSAINFKFNPIEIFDLFFELYINETKFNYAEFKDLIFTKFNTYEIILKDKYNYDEISFKIIIDTVIVEDLTYEIIGAENKTKVNKDVLIKFDGNYISVLDVRIDGRSKDYPIVLADDGFFYIEFLQESKEKHLYIIFVNVLDETDIMEIYLIIEGLGNPKSNLVNSISEFFKDSKNIWIIIAAGLLTISTIVIVFISRRAKYGKK